MHYSILPHRALLAITGEDTASFLQGLVSNDMRRLAPGHALYAAMLTPQGKFLHDFFLMDAEGGVLLDVDRARLPDLQQRLAMYRLRSKVTLKAAEGTAVAALWGADTLTADNGITLSRDPRLDALGWRAAGEKNMLESWCKAQDFALAPAGAYEHLRIQHAVPEGGSDMVPDKSFPLQFGLEDLHGVDFAKGCYVGQEVTARTKHLGQLRKFIYKVESSDTGLPPAGTPVYLGDELAGEMRSSSGKEGIALLNVEDAEKARQNHTVLRAGDVPVTASLPAWVAHKPAL